MYQTIDTKRIKQHTNLLALAERLTTLRRWTPMEWAGPCPNRYCSADRDGFHVHADGWWKCYTCHPRRGDIIELVQWSGLARDFRSACKWLDSSTATGSLPPKSESLATPNRRRWTKPTWQSEARPQVDAAVAALIQLDGEPGRAYLTGRGLLPETWDAWELGYCPGKRDAATQRVRPAIVMPWYWGARLCAVKYRFIDSQGGHDRFTSKCGGEQRLYGLQLCTHADTLLLVEGEFNAISLWQALRTSGRHLADVVSFGSESAGQNEYAAQLATSYEQVIVWADRPERAASAAATMPGARSLCSPTQGGRKLDANQLLQAGILTRFLACVLDELAKSPSGLSAGLA